MPILTKWELRFLTHAAQVSTWSKDPTTKTGAVLVDKNHQVISIGFNGFPRGIRDDERLNDRNMKYEMIVHCEINALIFAARDVRGSTLYTYPFISCSRCASVMIQAGITRVVAPKNTIDRWEDNLKLSRILFMEAGVEVLEV